MRCEASKSSWIVLGVLLLAAPSCGPDKQKTPGDKTGDPVEEAGDSVEEGVEEVDEEVDGVDDATEHD